MPEHNFIVEDLKIRLDRYLAKQLPEISRSRIQRDIEGGNVEVNGQPILESHFAVRLNDKVRYEVAGNRQLEGLKPTNTPLKVLYNNHGLIIIDKPAGMVVHPGAGFKGETLASALLYHFKDIYVVGEEHRPGIVHRLDKDTSGVMLVAKTQEMYEHLKDAFAERKIKKEYIALVAGKVEKPHGIIDTPMGKSKTDFRKQTTENALDPKEAVTEYRVLEYLGGEQSEEIGKDRKKSDLIFSDVSDLSGGETFAKQRPNQSRKPSLDIYTLLLVKLHTGRTHQIRVHLASIGHPLLGDELYGPRLRSRSGSARGKNSSLDGLHRQFLHAKKIEVRLPDKTWIEAESELADDLRKVLEKLNSKNIKQL